MFRLPTSRRPLTGLALLMAALGAGASTAAAHGGNPQVLGIRFPGQFPGEAWAVTDNQGLFAIGDGGGRWLCEDAVMPGAGFRAVVPVSPDGRRWLVATDLGLYATDDGGCSFQAVEGPLAGQIPLGIWPRGDGAGGVTELLVGTSTFNARNDVYRSTDGGLTWAAAGLDVDGRIYSVLRAPLNPSLVYVAHAEGAARSEDGGETFTDIPLGPEALEVQPVEFSLLAASRAVPDTLFGVVQRFPTSALVVSFDRGDAWQIAADLEEYPRGLVTDGDGRALAPVPFSGVLRQPEPGAPWTLGPEEIPFLGCLTHGPDGQTLWACSNIFFGGPWVLATSEDFGESWSPALDRFQSVSPTWGCPEESPSTLACRGFCPGEGPEAICDEGSVDAGAPTPDAGPPEGDGGPPPGEEISGRQRESCASTPGGAGGWWALLLLVASRRRRRLTPRRGCAGGGACEHRTPW